MLGATVKEDRWHKGGVQNPRGVKLQIPSVHLYSPAFKFTAMVKQQFIQLYFVLKLFFVLFFLYINKLGEDFPTKGPCMRSFAQLCLRNKQKECPYHHPSPPPHVFRT